MTLKRRIELLERRFFPEKGESETLVTWEEFCHLFEYKKKSDNLPPGSKVLVHPAERRVAERVERITANRKRAGLDA